MKCVARCCTSALTPGLHGVSFHPSCGSRRRYEWDEAKARKQYLIKFACAWLAAIALGALPVWGLVGKPHSNA
ncbi:hypothetical protein EHI47_12055 [Rhizobium leguminosarum]|uniref:Uncharacterized protein n=1 Tax=Rhizobium leguminosarum TaxID=384 RepID=A0A444I2S4_RHILE|nr:hypothetical protein EHI47_12055 [Rhizobium leguminosarum]